MQLATTFGLRELAAFIQHDLAAVYMMGGDFDRGSEEVERAQERWRDLDNRPMLADSMASLAYMSYFAGRLDRSETLSHEADALSRSLANAWGQSYSRLGLGSLYRDRGDIARAIRTMEECLALGEEAGFAVPGVTVRSELALLYAMLGDPDRGIPLTEVAFQAAQEFSAQWALYPLSLRARLHLLAGRLAEAEALMAECDRLQGDEAFPAFIGVPLTMARMEYALARDGAAQVLPDLEDGVALLQRQGILLYLPEFLHLKARALASLGQTAAAEESLRAARARAEAMRLRTFLWPILVDLAEAVERRGEAGEAASLRGAAAEAVHFIAEHTEDPTLRATFLALPRVRALLGSTQP
jgi:tetratricopeptide (TPR) repeat protein